MYVVEPTDRRNDVFQYHNSRKWEESENNISQEELEKSIDSFGYTAIKNYDVHIRSPPVHRQRKVNILH